MRNWEKIIQIAGKDFFKTRSDIKKWMFDHKVTPCDMEIEADLNDTFNKSSCDADCINCVDFFLDYDGKKTKG